MWEKPPSQLTVCLQTQPVQAACYVGRTVFTTSYYVGAYWSYIIAAVSSLLLHVVLKKTLEIHVAMKLCDCEIFCGIISEDPIFYLCACIQMWYYFNRTDLFVLLISSIPMFVFKIHWIQLLVHDNTTSPRACLDIAA